MQRKIFLSLLTMMGISLALHSQVPDFETYRKQQEESFQQFVAERDSIMQQMNKDFENYVEQRNREYAEYLENEWERMETFLAAEPDPGPKPDEMPAYDPEEEPVRDHDEQIEIRAVPPDQARVSPDDQFREPITIRPVEPDAPRIPTVNIDFYGRNFSVDIDRSFRGIRTTGIKETDVAKWFEDAANTNYTPTLINLLTIADETGMNDWALFMTTRKLGNRLANNNRVSSKLYTWFLLLQAGYDIRMARQNDELVFLMPFDHVVYNTPRLDIDGKTFYVIEGTSGDPLYTYEQTMPGAFRMFDMNFYKSPQLAINPASTTLAFYHNGNGYQFDLEYDPVLVAMLAEQPQADMKVYLDADASNYLVHASERILEPILEPMNDVEKVSFLLALSQNAFEYQTDIDQFGQQRYMVPDEVIHYTYSDCDDRAVLFGWLVRNYAGQQVAALLYPGHLANAVHFKNGNPQGDYVMINGKAFVVADPTFINAPIGLTMPEFANVAPTAWVIDSGRYLFEQSLAVWQVLHKKGARRGNNQRDVVFDDQGNIYATGYFTDVLLFEDSRIRLQAPEEQRMAFIASMDSNMQTRWASAFSSGNDATGFSLLKDNNGNLIMAGTFAGELSYKNREIKSQDGQHDAFVAAFNTSGQLQWLKEAGLDNSHNNNAVAYSLHVDPAGQTSDLHYFNDPRENLSGLFLDSSGQLVLTGTFGNTSGLTMHDAPELASAARLNYAELLIDKNKELIDQNVEASIAGLFAAINITKSEGVVFPGSAAQQALNNANPSFRRQFPTTFANIGKISFLRNKSGIIEIRTENGDDVFFDKMRIRNGSTVRVRSLANGDEQIDILSNIHVGQAIIWYPLNYIRLYHRSGDLLFDYRRNNSQVTLNLREDILN